jgi:glycerol-3-phosphate dehydrogenase
MTTPQASPETTPELCGFAARSAAPWREEILLSLREDPAVDVLVLGGGINGVGLFRELALEGVSTLLVERADFASGATSKSSRMIHGGLRYLENREFGLVRESLLERNRLLVNAPHFVSPLKTTIPLFSRLGGLVRSPLVFLGLPVRPGGRGAAVVKLGLSFYDLVTRRDRRTPTHFFTSREDSLLAYPGLNPDIVTTATYWDARVSQAERLAVELVLDARRANPRCRALNYATVSRIEAPGLTPGAVRLLDAVTGASVDLRPRVVVNATGAWVDHANASLGVETRFMRGTKGSHIVVENRELHDALGGGMVYYEHADGRVCIAFPFEGKTIMGSTDIPVDDPDEARCDDAEVDYMRSTLRGVFPRIEVAPRDIVFKFCGVRPLPAAGDKIVGTITRGHTIRVLEPEGSLPFPILSLVGGKWTTFRALAEEAADQVLGRLGKSRRGSTRSVPIGGGRDFPAGEGARERWVERVAEASGLSTDRVSLLLERSGTIAEDHARRVSGGGEVPLQTLHSYTREELEGIARTEYVERLSDLVLRRSTIALLGDARPEVLEEIAKVIGGPLGWDLPRREEEVARTLAEVARG